MLKESTVKPKIILASGSPRRKQLLAQVGIECEIIVSNVDETCTGPPAHRVAELSNRKAQAVKSLLQENHPHGYAIIAADTLVYVNNQVLEKPETPEAAYEMLSTLRGRGHTVYTGVTIIANAEVNTFVDSTQVYFRDFSDDEIHAYIATGEPFDKAGAYGVQDKGALLVHRVEGDYFTVVGLPVAKVASTLRDMGIEIW